MKAILTIILISTSISPYAQSEIISSNFWSNYAHINPAMSALEYKKHGTLMYRNYKFSTVTNFTKVLANFNFLLADKHGLGVNYSYDKTSSLKEHKAMLNYNYQFNFKKGSTLSLGAGLGLYSNTIDAGLVAALIAGDSTLVVANKLDALSTSLGISYNAGNLMLGVGMDNLLEDAVSTRKTDEFFLMPPRAIYLIGHYKIKLGKNKGLEIRPQFIVRTDFSFTATDLNVLATFRKKFWAGVTYRNRDAFSFMFGWDIKEKIRVGYAYDIVQSQLTSATQQAHEINLGFFLK